MSATTVTTWIRVTKAKPCLICGRPDWCGFSSDGQFVACMRVAEGSIRETGNGGFLHQVDPASTPSTLPPIKKQPAPRSSIDMTKLASQFHDAVDLDGQLETEAGYLGVSALSLYLLRIGWSRADNAWSFPMRDENQKVIGIRLRSPNGRKWCVRGSRTGLFIPIQLPGDSPLMICEGPTDLAALLTVGIDAIGRPSNVGGADLIYRWLKKAKRRRDIVVIHDRDERGTMAEQNTRRGAQMLIQRIARVVSTAKVIMPPRDKDVRQWVQRGATKQLIECVCHNAEYVVTRCQQEPQGLEHSVESPWARIRHKPSGGKKTRGGIEKTSVNPGRP